MKKKPSKPVKNGRSKKAAKKQSKKNNDRKKPKEKTNKRNPGNVRRPGKSSKRGPPIRSKANVKRKVLKKKKSTVKRSKLTSLQITRRYNKWFSDHISKKTGRIGNYSYDVSNKILDIAYTIIARGGTPVLSEIVAHLNEGFLNFSEAEYQVSADSVKTLIRGRAYLNKKIKTIDIFGKPFETKYNEVAVEIAENNQTYFWIIIDRIRKKHTIVSPVFLPFITERKQTGNPDKKTGKVPRVLKVDFSREESINGVKNALWQKYKKQLEKELK